MICIIALVVFSIVGIFSATHRALAKEALDCVLRRVTFRPCNTGFDEKMKGMIVGRLLNRSVFAARFVKKYFEFISWGFIVLLTIRLKKIPIFCLKSAIAYTKSTEKDFGHLTIIYLQSIKCKFINPHMLR